MRILLIGMLALSIVACSGTGSADTEDVIVGKLTKLHETFASKYTAERVNQEDLKQELVSINDTAIQLVESLVANYPESKVIAEQYFLVGESSMKLKKGELAIKYFTLLEEKFPTHDNIAWAIYNKAYTYENVNKDVEKAILTYKQVYKKHPTSEWAESAKSQVLYLNNPTFIGQ